MKLDHQTAQVWIEMKADGVLDKEKTAVLEAYLNEHADARHYADSLRRFEHELSDSLQTRWPRTKQVDVTPVLKRLEQRKRVKRVVGGVRTAVVLSAFVALFGVWLLALRAPANSSTIAQPQPTVFPSFAPPVTEPAPTASPFPDAGAMIIPLVEPFDQVEISGYATLAIVRGETAVLQVTTEEDMTLVVAEVVDGVLTLGNVYTEKAEKPPIHFELAVPSLTGIRASGSGQIESAPVLVSPARIEASGSGNVRLGAFSGDQLTIEAGGSADVWIGAAGEVTTLVAKIGGSSNLFAFETAAKTAVVDSEGSATVRINVVERLTGSADGSSTIHYRGSPTVDVGTFQSASVVPDSPQD